MTLLFTLFVSPPAAEPMPLGEVLAPTQMAARSDAVVVGEVTAVWVEGRDGAPWTVASVLVEETLLGEPDRLLQVSWPGGDLGRTQLSVSGSPELHAGDRAVFFVQADGRPVGLSQGVLFVESDEFVWRDLSGHAAGPTLPEGPEAFSLAELRRTL
jgi:hypothetical protein